MCEGTVGPAAGDENLKRTNKDRLPGSLACSLPADPSCNPAALTNRLADDALANQLAAEALNLGGADIIVYKMLGVHEQCKLVDSVGNGSAISSGDTPLFPAANAFDMYLSEWRSVQRGPAVPASAFIGYDFGEVKTPRGHVMYSTDASVRKHITAFAIKQSANASNRVVRARLERSDDGVKWFGVEVVDLPDNDCLNTVMVRSSAPMRFWRLRAITFNGSAGDYWGVQALQLYHNYEATAIDNVQDKILMENRNRDYSPEPIYMKCRYDPQDIQTDLAKFGIGFEMLSNSYTIQMSFASCVAQLGRPIIIGDILNLPSETQYTPTMEPILKWLEVTDVGWDSSSFSAAWRPVLYRVIAQPLMASEETQDIFGDLAPVADETGLLDRDDGNSNVWQDYGDISQTIKAFAKDRVPEKGATVSSAIRKFEDAEVQAARDAGLPNLERIGQNDRGLYVEDALPPNDADYTQGDTFPANPKNGEYHRLTYSQLNGRFPARLYRYSSTKGRWIFMEQDRRALYDPTKPIINDFLTTETETPNAKVTNHRPDLGECE
jgi:hypothetical protein